MSESQLLIDIVQFLNDKLAKGEVAVDEKESLELAVDCIRETFNVSASAKAQNLLDIYKKGVMANSGPSSASAQASTSGSTPVTPVPEISAEVKAEADELKAKGNKLMAQRDFKGAADAYTEAISKNPGNPLYYSNRAAAFTHLSLNSRAVEDATKATELDPGYSKAWSRLGLALWAQGDIKGSLDAYENGLKAEGDSPSEAMKRDYDNVKKRFDEETAKSASLDTSKNLSRDVDTEEKSEPSQTGAGTGSGGSGFGGGFDFSQLSSMMSNPQIQQMAKNFMSNPSALGELMNSPMAKQMKDNLANGNMPDFSQLSKMMGGNGMPDMKNSE